jgi:hypothetical protein
MIRELYCQEHIREMALRRGVNSLSAIIRFLCFIDKKNYVRGEEEERKYF